MALLGLCYELIVDLFGATLTLTAAYMKKSNLFIGNDSGLMHLATACNLLTIALFGPTNDIVYGPWGHKNIVIRTKEDYDYFKKIKINRNLSYMNSITPEEVYEKIKLPFISISRDIYCHHNHCCSFWSCPTTRI